MRRRRVMVVVVACVVAVVVVAMVSPREREPEYGGKKLSEWIKNVTHADVEGREARDAVQHIGTNAVPWLLRWVRYEPPAWKIKAYSLMEKAPQALQMDFLMSRLDTYRPDRPDNLALTGFAILGERASPAVPELVRMMKNPKPSAIAMRAVMCLAAIGEPGLAALNAALSDPVMRHAASNALEQIGNPVRY